MISGQFGTVDVALKTVATSKSDRSGGRRANAVRSVWMRLRGASGRLTGSVRIRLRPAPIALLLAAAVGVCPASLAAAPQQPAQAAPESLDRIKEDLARGPVLKLTTKETMQLRPTFKARTDVRVFVPTLEEVLHKEFDLNELQRQSARWAAQCCGFNLSQIPQWIEDGIRDRKIRKTREQIQRELAEIESNIRKQLADAKAPVDPGR
jgi:hypothetical protein